MPGHSTHYLPPSVKPCAQRSLPLSVLLRSARLRPLAAELRRHRPFRLETGGRRYLLRMEGQPSPLRNPSPVRLHAHRSGGGDCTEDPLYRRGGPHRGDRLHRPATAEDLSGRAARVGAGAGRDALARSERCRPSHTSSTIRTSSRACSRMCAAPVSLRPACSMRTWNDLNGFAKPVPAGSKPDLQPQRFDPQQHPVRWRTPLADRLGVGLSQ